MTRVGATEKVAIERLGVRVIDASEAGWGIINHDLFLSKPEVRRVIRCSRLAPVCGMWFVPWCT